MLNHLASHGTETKNELICVLYFYISIFLTSMCLHKIIYLIIKLVLALSVRVRHSEPNKLYSLQTNQINYICIIKNVCIESKIYNLLCTVFYFCLNIISSNVFHNTLNINPCIPFASILVFNPRPNNPINPSFSITTLIACG